MNMNPPEFQEPNPNSPDHQTLEAGQSLGPAVGELQTYLQPSDAESAPLSFEQKIRLDELDKAGWRTIRTAIGGAALIIAGAVLEKKGIVSAQLETATDYVGKGLILSAVVDLVPSRRRACRIKGQPIVSWPRRWSRTNKPE